MDVTWTATKNVDVTYMDGNQELDVTYTDGNQERKCDTHGWQPRARCDIHGRVIPNVAPMLKAPRPNTFSKSLSRPKGAASSP